MDWAARAGHLEVVKFLSENREEGCTTDAMDWAARAGHLEVVKFLSENARKDVLQMQWIEQQ
jgi:ankyrin repeat protein